MSTFDLCNLKYYLSYMIGIKDAGNKASIIGNMVHTTLETISNLKKEWQKSTNSGDLSKNGILYKTISNELGQFEVSESQFFGQEILPNSDIDQINTSRPKNYYSKAGQIAYGTKRRGRVFVNCLIKRSYEYYIKENPSFNWTQEDFNQTANLAWLTIEQFDPRDYEIVEAELDFDMPIDLPGCVIELQGKKLAIRVKGFIDLVYKEGNQLGILDFKTGARKDWVSGKVKGIDELSDDLQLCLYYYVCCNLFPDKEICVNILYVRDGGMYTVPISANYIEEMENTIESHLEEIRACTLPKPLSSTQSHFKCGYCHYSKSKTFGAENDCATIYKSLQRIGLDETTKKYSIKKDTK